MRKLRVLGSFLTIAGIVIVFASAIFPLIQLPQKLVKRGPNIKFDESINYWIDIIGLPLIKKGTAFYLELVGDNSGGLILTVLPSKDGTPIAGSSPLIAYSFNTDQKSYTSSTTIEVESEYMVSVVSINNYYLLTINSVWSPFDSYKSYLYLGLFALPAGLLLLYYDNILEKREKLIESVEQAR
jgi:hypothetical protein